jgi:hypothetical protein
MSTETVDPLSFVCSALELLPDDPAEASVDDLGRIAAICQGLGRFAHEVRDEMTVLALRVLEDPSSDVSDELASLSALHARCELALGQIIPYIVAALHAHGFDRLTVPSHLTDQKENSDVPTHILDARPERAHRPGS